jgi:PAS domain S-box-containing protein
LAGSGQESNNNFAGGNPLEINAELEAIISCSYDGIFITDGQGIVLRINQAYERITGIKAEEVIGQDMNELVLRNFYDQSVTVLVIKQRKSITINQQVRGSHQILVTGNPIFDKQGSLVRVVTNVRDITELVNLQDELTQTKEQTRKYKAELSHLRAMHVKDKQLIFCSAAMGKAVELARKVAEVDSTVLITGESGTGKELIAKLIHEKGKGTDKPFIKINCAAIPENLIESELFGYEGGAFTGALREGKPGLFELAHKGTLFLDEVGDLPPQVQVKLLRVLQEKEVVRVGGGKAIKVDVRIISATHRDIEKMVKDDQFREDLYYRLMVIPLHITALRDRKEDISVLIPFFIDKFNMHFGFHKIITPQTVDKLVKYSWPGNVRELENLIERMMVTAPGDELTEDLLPEIIFAKSYLPQKCMKLKDAVEQTEKYLLTKAFIKCGSWNQAAELLGVDRATIFRKVAKYGLKTKEVAKFK